MTNKEYMRAQLIVVLIIGFGLGMIIGSLITSLRYDAEIIDNQVELQVKVDEIMADKAEIEGLINELSLQVDGVRAERRSLEKLKILWSKGEGWNE